MNHSERVDRRKNMAELVHNGTPVGEVANLFNMSMTQVKRAHAEFYPDEPRTNGLPRSSSTVKIVALLLTTDLNFREIADQVGVKYQRVSDVAKELESEGMKRHEILHSS